MSDTFLRVTWIDVDREVERDISTREQKTTYKLDVNVKVTCNSLDTNSILKISLLKRGWCAPFEKIE